MLMKEIFDISKSSLQPWKVDTDYAIGQLVYTGGSIYKALTAHHSATDVFATDEDEYWELIVGGANAGSNIPVGGIVPFSGDQLPPGFLYCHGQAVSRETYSQLFKVIGETFGAGDSLTTFNVPDFRGRVPVGQAMDINYVDSDGFAYFTFMGATGGAITRSIELKNLPAHTHELQDKTHYHDGGDGTNSSNSYTNQEWRVGSSTYTYYIPRADGWRWESGNSITGSGYNYPKSDLGYGTISLAHRHFVKGATIKNWRTKHNVLDSSYQTVTKKDLITVQPYQVVDYIICFRRQLDLSDLTVDEWQPQTQYYEDDIVYYGGKLYKCKTNCDHVSGDVLDKTQLENWILLSGTDDTFEMAEWEANVDYVVGDLVWHDGTVYRAKAEHTSTTFETDTQTNWDVVIAPRFSHGLRLSAKFNTLTPIEDMVAYMKAQEHHENSTGGVKYLFDINTSYELSPGRCMKFFCEAIYFSENFVYFEATPQQRFDYASGDRGVAKYQGTYANGVFHGWQPIDSIKQWMSHVAYNKDDMVFHDGHLYSRIATGQIEVTFNEDEWKRYVTSDEVNAEDMIKPWQADTDYTIDNLVYINGILYKAIADHTSTTNFEDDIANWEQVVGIGQPYADEIDNAKISSDTAEYDTLKERLDMTQVHVIENITVTPLVTLPVGTLATFPNTDAAGAIYRCIAESLFGTSETGALIAQNPVNNPNNWELIVSVSYKELDDIGKILPYGEYYVDHSTFGDPKYYRAGDLVYYKDSIWRCKVQYEEEDDYKYPDKYPEYWVQLYGGYNAYVATRESSSHPGYNNFTSLDERLNQGLIEKYDSRRDLFMPITADSDIAEPYCYKRTDLCTHDGIIFRRKKDVTTTNTQYTPATFDDWDEYLLNKDLHVSNHGYVYSYMYTDEVEPEFLGGTEICQRHYAVKNRLDHELIEMYHGPEGAYSPEYLKGTLVQLDGNLYRRIRGEDAHDERETYEMHPVNGSRKDIYWDRYALMSDINPINQSIQDALTNEHGDTYTSLKERLDTEGIARYSEDYNDVYNTNDLVQRDGVIYKCLEDNVRGSETWDETKWVKYLTAEDNMDNQEIIDARTNVHDITFDTLKERLDAESIETFNETAVYDFGDIIQYEDGYLYRCISADTTGAFDVTKWDKFISSQDYAEVVAARTNKYTANYDSLGVRLDAETIPMYYDRGTYNTGALVQKDDVIYKCLEDGVTGLFDETKWDRHITEQDIQELIDAKTNGHDVEYSTLKERLDLEVIEYYSPDAIYEVDELVQLDGNIYKRTVATGAADGAFDETQWVKFITEDEIPTFEPWQANTTYSKGTCIYTSTGFIYQVTDDSYTTGSTVNWDIRTPPLTGKTIMKPTSDECMTTITGINGDVVGKVMTDLLGRMPFANMGKHTYCVNLTAMQAITNNPFATTFTFNDEHSLFIEIYAGLRSGTYNLYAYADAIKKHDSISKIYHGTYYDPNYNDAGSTYNAAYFSGWEAIDGVKPYSTDIAYKTNDMVFYDGNLYSRTVQTDTLDAAFDETQWQRYLTESDLFNPQPWQANTTYYQGDVYYKDGFLIRQNDAMTTGNEFDWGSPGGTNCEKIITPSSDECMTYIASISGDVIQYVVEDLFDRFSTSYVNRGKHTYRLNLTEQASVTNNPFRTTTIFNTQHSLFIEVYRNDTHHFNFYAYADNIVNCESVSHIFYGSYVDDTRTNTYDATKFSGWKAIDGIKAYNENLVYKTNDVVFYDGNLYSRTVETNAIDGAWDETQWQRYLTEEDMVNFVPWQPNTTFQPGQIVYKDGFMYSPKTPITSGAEFSWDISTNYYDIYSQLSSDSNLSFIGGIDGDIVGKVVQNLFDRVPYVYRGKHSYLIGITYMNNVKNNPFTHLSQFNEQHTLFIDIYRNSNYSMDLYAYARGAMSIDNSCIYHGYYDGTDATYDETKFSGWQPIDGLKSYQPNKIVYTIDDIVTKDGETYRRIVETGAVDAAWDDTQWVRFLTSADNVGSGAQADWNETDAGAESFILNKPAIGDLADLTTADKTNLVAAINEAAASGGQSDWNETDNTSSAFIQNKPAIGDVNALLTDDKTDIVTSINEIHEELEDFVLHEDYTGTATVTTDLSTRVADLEVDTAALMTEVEDARTSTDGTAHGNIGQRMDAIEDAYLPLTGGTLTGELKVKQQNALRLTANNGRSAIIRNDGDHLYFLTTDIGDEDGWFNALRPLRINLANEMVTVNGALEVVDRLVTNTINSFNGDLNIAATGGAGGMIGFSSPVMFRDKTMYDGGNVTVTSATDSKALTINSFQVGEVVIGCSNTGCNFSTTMNNFTFDKHILPTTNGTLEIGSTNNRYNALWVNNINTGNIYAPNSNLRMSAAGGSIQSQTIAPIIDNTYMLGIDTLRWSVLYSVNGVVQGSDENLKEDIRVVADEDYFNMIKGTEVKSYLYKQSQDGIMVASDRTQETVDNNDLSLGVVAQDLANYESAKYVLQEGESGYSINLYNYTASVHSALRHEIALREALEQENQELKDRLAAIEAHLGL